MNGSGLWRLKTFLFSFLMVGFTGGALNGQDSFKLKLESGQPVTIVCFGDSVTGLYYHTGGRRTYTDMLGMALRQAFPDAKVTLVNAGVSGNTVQEGLTRIDRDVLAHNPDLVTVMFGLNDMLKTPLEDYRKDLVALLERCRSVDAEVLLCTPNAITDTSNRSTEELLKYCQAMREVAREHQTPLCDTFAAFEALRKKNHLKWRLMMSDALHPNMAGHKYIAEQISSSLVGRSVSLSDIGPPTPSIPKTIALLNNNQPVRVLAMPPYDQLIKTSIAKHFATAKLEVSSWDTEAKSLHQLEQEAHQRVREMKPDLVILAMPRSAAADSQEAFINSTTWIMNWSLSFGRQEWDCLVVHPSVANPDSSDVDKDDLIRKLTAAQDLSLIDRQAGNHQATAEIFADWLLSELEQN
jgi:lysophospholipase L1-like esterase